MHYASAIPVLVYIIPKKLLPQEKEKKMENKRKLKHWKKEIKNETRKKTI